MTQQEFESRYVNQIICGDCLEVMKDWPDKCVDLVLKKDLTNKTESDIIPDYEQTRTIQESGGRQVVESPQGRDNMALQGTDVVAGESGELLQGFTDCDGQSHKTVRYPLKQSGEAGGTELQIQGRLTKHAVPSNDRKGQMRELRGNRKSGHSPQERQSSGQPPEKPTNSVRQLPQQLSQKNVVGKAKIVCITDPPYGINVDTSWLSALNMKRGKPVNKSDDRLQGDNGELDLSFLWIFPCRIIFGHPYIYDPNATGWLVWDKQPGVARRGIVSPVELASTTCWKGFDIIRYMWGGYMREAGEIRYKHPTQKPLGLMQILIEENSNENDLILDPFCGSGTTCVAAKMLGRRYIGIDISPKYCEIARQRLEAVDTGVPVKERGQLPLFPVKELKKFYGQAIK